MKKIIYDLGACRGENLNYYLSNADLVVAAEANPENCEYISKNFLEDIKKKKLILLNCIVGTDPNIDIANFYIHKHNYLLGQFPIPNNKENEFEKIQIKHLDVLNIFKEYGDAYYIKIDLEEYDHIILERILVQDIKFTYLSSEIKKIDDFTLFSKFKKINSFKIIDGHNVEYLYKYFLQNSAGPFGNDIKGPWISYANFIEILKFKLNQNGWFDVHCSLIDQEENTFNYKKYIFLEKLKNFKVKYKKKILRWKIKYLKQ